MEESRGMVIMTIISETPLREFESWAGGRDTMNCLTWEQLDTIEGILEDIFPDGMTDTQLNDLMWFDNDWIAELLGFSDWEDLMADAVPWRVDVVIPIVEGVSA
jgi:hypothetical protein